MQIYKCDPCLLPHYYGFNYSYYKSLAEKSITDFPEKFKPKMATTCIKTYIALVSMLQIMG